MNRDKYTLEQDIREKEEAIRLKSAEVQVRRPAHALSVTRPDVPGDACLHASLK